jgi:hypothetical protein
MRLALAFTFLVVGTAEANGQTPKQYPYAGDLYYDGNQYADSYFSWAAVGEWERPYMHSGWEMDISLVETYFDSCTSWTNLPYPYDDCPTAGWFDPSGARNFGIGSFDKSYIQAQTLYRGRWWFGGGYSASTSVNVAWQEVTTQICSDRYDIWCYNGIDGSSLLSTSWRYLQSSFAEWDYSSSVW